MREQRHSIYPGSTFRRKEKLLGENILTLLERLDALLAETEKATPGPWFVKEYPGVLPLIKMSFDEIQDIPNVEDAEFIASARTCYPAALRALKKAVEMVRILSVQATPEEYEKECGSEMDADCGLEAYERLVLDGRKALAEIEKELG